MNRPLRIGVLCFDLSVASGAILTTLARRLPEYEFVAFPIFGPPPERVPPFAFRRTNNRGKALSFRRLDGRAPEVMLRTVGWRIARELVASSDVALLLGLQAVPALLVGLLAKAGGKPVVAAIQGMLPPAERQRSGLIRWPKAALLRLATVCVAQTPGAARTLSEVYRVPADRIIDGNYDGGAADFCAVLSEAHTPDRDALRARWNIAPGAYVVTYVGTLVHLKGVDVLIRAFAAVIARHANSVLLVVGPDGTHRGTRGQLERLTAQMGLTASVRFLGSCPREALPGVYRASDVLALPTRKDMWPKVLAEAGLAGLPLVTTEVCGAAGYVVRHGQNGYVVPPDDVPALASALLELHDEGLRARLGARSPAIVGDYIRPGVEEASFRAAIERAVALCRQ